MKVDFDQLDTEQRRILLVASDDRYRALTDAIDRRAVGLGVLAALTVGQLSLISAVVGAGAASSTYLAATFGYTGARLSARIRKPWDWFRVGEIPIPHLSPAEAARRFDFDLGGPEEGAAYVLNPVRPRYYLRPAIANERLAQERLSAFLQLCSSLGAREVTVTSGETLSGKGGGKGGVPLPKAAAQIGLQANFSTDHEVARAAVARFGKPKKAPSVPAELRGWLDRDPVLDGLARSRMEGSVEELGVVLSFRDEIDLSASLCVDMARKGISVGGTYQTVATSRWAFQVSFWPKED